MHVRRHKMIKHNLKGRLYARAYTYAHAHPQAPPHISIGPLYARAYCLSVCQAHTYAQMHICQHLHTFQHLQWWFVTYVMHSVHYELVFTTERIHPRSFCCAQHERLPTFTHAPMHVCKHTYIVARMQSTHMQTHSNKHTQANACTWS